MEANLIEMTEFIYTAGKEVLAAFKDHTGLILHGNKSCMTYFSSTGDSSNVLTDEIPQNEKMRQKFIEAAKVHFI